MPKAKPERDTQIIAQLKRKRPTKDIAAEFGITAMRVRQIGARVGVFAKRNRLTVGEKSEALRQLNSGVQPNHIRLCGRSNRCAYEYLVRTGIVQPQPREFWPAEDDAILVELYGSSLSARKIAEKLGRTRNEVIGRANRLGLCKSKSKPANQHHHTSSNNQSVYGV